MCFFRCWLWRLSSSYSAFQIFWFRITWNAKCNKNTGTCLIDMDAAATSDTHGTRKIKLTCCLKFHVGEMHHKFYWPLFFLHPETVFWLCKTMSEIQSPHKSHKADELVSRYCFFSLFWFQVWPEFWVWFQSPDTFCSGQGFQCQGWKKLNTVRKTLQDVIRSAIWHFLPPKCFSSHTHSRRGKALSCTCMDANTKYAPAVSHKTHTGRHVYVHNNHMLSACLPESQSPFPRTILHCFLQSPNWLYSDPALRPESQTIKKPIYIPAATTWAPSHSVWLLTSTLIICVWF